VTMRDMPEQVFGPYEQDEDGRVRWRVVRVTEGGERRARLFKTERAAELYKAELLADLGRDAQTTETALAEYLKHLAEKGTKQQSRDVTQWAIEQFFPTPIAIGLLSPKRCEKLYEDLRSRPTPRSLARAAKHPDKYKPEPLAPDTHRNILSQTKSFLEWCVKKGWISENPCADVEGLGARRPRGKSLGKSGNELRVKQARAWYRKALELADGGDEGAIAALVALLLGLRASEIVSRKVGDLDEDELPGDLLWIPDSKTPAGRRTCEVPEVLRELLVECADGKAAECYLFECERPHEVGLGKPHGRDWVLDQVHRVCELAQVPKVTAHAMRGLTATIAGERGVISHIVADALGHEHERTTEHSYMRRGAKQAGTNRRGLTVLEGGLKESKP
jgi:integrase